MKRLDKKKWRKLRSFTSFILIYLLIVFAIAKVQSRFSDRTAKQTTTSVASNVEVVAGDANSSAAEAELADSQSVDGFEREPKRI